MILLLYMAIGAFAGTIAGLFGVGGGIIIVPLLATIFEHSDFPSRMIMHFAAGTSLAIISITSISSLRAHIKLGNDVWPIVKYLLPGLALGTVTGGILADFLHSDVLKMMLGGLLLIIAFRAFFARQKEHQEHTFSILGLRIGSFFSGCISGMLGVGGGTIIVPLLLYYNVRIHLAVAVSAACGIIVALVGATTFMITGANEIHNLHWTTGYIYWPAFLGVGFLTPIFAKIGAQLSLRIPPLYLKRLFSSLILIVGIKMLFF